MSQEESMSEYELPKSVTHIHEDGKDYYIIGTAHVSQQSVDDVKQVIANIKPDNIVVELCKARHESIKNPERWKNMDIFQVIKAGKGMFLLANLLLTSYQKKIADKLGTKAGGEMVAALELASELDTELTLGDRDVQITLKRTWAGFGLWQKITMGYSMLSSAFGGVDVKEEDLENLKESDSLNELLEELGKTYPVIKERLIHERDLYLMDSISKAKGKKIVAIVGAGHVPGIKKHWKEEVDLDEITKIPPPSKVTKSIKWIVPLLILCAFAYGFLGKDVGWDLVVIWVMTNGILAAIGALIALAHPLTIITAFVAAPITSLNPLVAAGWVSGLMEAYLRKPKVSDCESLQEDITTVKGFYKNRITRVLLVVVMSNFGSMLGTWIAAAGIFNALK